MSDKPESVSLRERIRRWWKPVDYEDEHPLSEQERQERQPFTMQEELGKLGGGVHGGPPIHPEDVRRQYLRSGEYGPTKTKAGVRSIALPADLKQLLLELRMQSKHSLESEPIFAARSGKPLGHRNVTRRGWEAAREEQGFRSRFRSMTSAMRQPHG